MPFWNIEYEITGAGTLFVEAADEEAARLLFETGEIAAEVWDDLKVEIIEAAPDC